MRTYKKGISMILSVVLCASVLPSVTHADAQGFYENFESMTVGEEPVGSSSYDIKCLSGTGAIVTEEREGNKYIAIKNYDEGTPVLMKYIFPELNGTVSAGVDFCQRGAKSDGNVIMRLLKGDTAVCSVETKDGDIVYKKADGDIVLADSYEKDVVYSIRLEISIGSGTVDIYLNDASVHTGAPVLNSANSLSELRSLTTFSPGFELDNVFVRPSGEIAAAKISGNNIMSIPSGANPQSYTYKASAFTTDEDEISAAAFTWSITPDDGKVTLVTVDEKTAEIQVSPDAVPDTEYTLTAAANGSSVSAQQKLTVKNAALGEIKIIGKGSLSLGLADVGDKYDYTAKIYDEFGNEMADRSVNWEISGEGSQYFDIASNSGTLTVKSTGDVTSELTVKATLRSDSSKFATRKISLVDLRSYLSDETRRNIIKTYMDTALEYGKDIYNGSPRIADAINRDGEPIKWRTVSGDEVPIADMGNEWELLRTMIAYSDTVGDPYYRERAYEMYRWTLEHDISDNGLVYWGSHKGIDMRTGEATGDKDAGIGNYHEIEEKDMYFAPFYEINPERTAELVSNIWMAHVIETKDANKNPLGWTDLMFNRHGYYDKDIGEEFKNKTWDNLDAYDDDYYLNDAFIRTKDSYSPFFLAASEYISAAVELYNETRNSVPELKAEGDKALTWAKRLAYRFANLADKKTGIVPRLTSTPYGDPEIRDENGNLSFNIRPKWVDQLSALPSGEGMGAPKYGDRVYVQFAQGMEDAGLLDDYNVWEHLPLPDTLAATNPELVDAMKKDKNKGLILEMYYYRNWPWAYGRSMFSVLELIDTLGLERPEGLELFSKWMHGYRSYIDIAYTGNSEISVMFASGVKLDGFVTTVPGTESRKGSTLDKTVITMESVLPAIEALSMLNRLESNVVLYTGSTEAENVTVGDVEATLWRFINSMADYNGMGYLGEGRLSSLTDPDPDYHTTCEDANALNVVLELYRHTEKPQYLKLARIIANNIVTEQYSGGFFVPEERYGTWTSSYAAAVLMKLDAIINNTWSEALDFSFESYVYHQAKYIDEHGKIPSTEHDSRHTEEYTKVLAKKIKVDKENITMSPGDVEQLEVTVLPDDADSKGYYWEISDQSVVRLDDDNNIYAVGRGEAVIRAVINNSAVESADIYITVE